MTSEVDIDEKDEPWSGAKGAILFHSTGFLQSRHNAALLSLIDRADRAGREVVVLACSGQLVTCAANPEHLPDLCRDCVIQQQHDRRLLGDRAEFIPLRFPRRPPPSPPSSMDGLLEHEHDGRRIGRFVANDLVFRARDVGLSIDDAGWDVGAMLGSAIGLFEAARSTIIRHHVTDVIVLNGRRSSEGPVTLAAQALGARTWSFEGHRDDGRPHLIPAPIVQDLDARKSELGRVIRQWQSEGGIPRELRAHLDRILGAYRQGGAAVPNQRLFLTDAPLGLEDDATDQRPIAAIFTSSSWERFGLPGYGVEAESDFGYADLRELLRSEELRSAWRVVVRWHPNLMSAGAGERELISAMERELLPLGVDFIAPEDPRSSYELMARSSVVITNGSSMGLEATIAGKPSVLLGRRYYEDSGAVHSARSPEEVLALLRRWPALEPQPAWLAEACLLYFWGFHLAPSEFVARDPHGVLRLTSTGQPTVAPRISRRRRWRARIKRLAGLLAPPTAQWRIGKPS